MIYKKKGHRQLQATAFHVVSLWFSENELVMGQIRTESKSNREMENKVHWVLDVDFHEDQARNRTDHSAENMQILRHMAMNLLGREKTSRTSFRSKRLKASWSDDYILKLLSLAWCVCPGDYCFICKNGIAAHGHGLFEKRPEGTPVGSSRSPDLYFLFFLFFGPVQTYTNAGGTLRRTKDTFTLSKRSSKVCFI